MDGRTPSHEFLRIQTRKGGKEAVIPFEFQPCAS